jgi:hypothetical protein
MFQADGCLYGELRALLFAVACERPMLGYVQGMSHLGALLLLYMSPLQAYLKSPHTVGLFCSYSRSLLTLLQAYRSLVGLLDAAPHLEPFFLVDMPAISRYGEAFDTYLACHRPKVATRLRQMGVDSRIFILKWWITCFTAVLSPLDASRLWDKFVVRGISCLLAFSMALLEQLFKAHPVNNNFLCK